MDDSPTRVLVVDDEVPLAALIGSYLERDGFAVSLAHDGVAAVEAARRIDPDVVVLDLGLPGLDGLEVCRRLRQFSDCYLIMLTARVEEVDRLVGLSVGADDYVTKPFSVRELVARVHAMLRRPRRGSEEAGLSPSGSRPGPLPAPAPSTASGPDEPPPRVFGDLQVDVAGREVRVAGRPVELTRTEFDVLAALSARPKMAFTRRQLVEAVWGGGWVGDEHLVDVHVGHLRRKLGDDPARPRYVRTIRGVGYRMGDGLGEPTRGPS